MERVDTDRLGKRYSRQMLLEQIGREGQEKLLDGSVLLVGCGALGSTIANMLARAGVGTIRIVDRDVVELNNLQRQILYDEKDVEKGLPKSEAAARKLRKSNSSIRIEPIVQDVTSRNIERLIEGASLVLDGTDNFETRYIINDACVKHGIPWIYGGVIGSTGMTLNIFPGKGPCLRCIFPEPPPPGSLPTCDTAGIMNTVPSIIASIQATEACKILLGSADVSRRLLHVDVWHNSFQRIEIFRSTTCPACMMQEYEFLKRAACSWVTALCGRNAVQITPAADTEISFSRLSERLSRVGEVSCSDLLLRAAIDEYELILFPDGRAIVKGTSNESVAKGLYSKFVGS